MGKRSTSTSQSVQTGAMTAEEKALQAMLSNLAGDIATNIQGIGDPTDLTLPPEFEELITKTFNTRADQERAVAEADFKDILAQTGDYLASRGVQDSSIEKGELSKAGIAQALKLGDIEARRSTGTSEAMLSMPFQIAGVNQGGLNSLANLLNYTSSPVLRAMLETRLANTNITGTEDVTGATLGELMPGIGALGGGN